MRLHKSAWKSRALTLAVSVGAAVFMVDSPAIRLSGQDTGFPGPLSEPAVVRLLKGDVSPKRVAAIASEREIDFQVTPDVESELRRAGATNALLATLRKLAPTPQTQAATEHYRRGNALFIAWDLDGAIKEYREAIRLRPDYAPLHRGLATALGLKRDFDGEIAEAREAIRLKPGDANLHMGLVGVLFNVKGDLDGTIVECREAIRLKPDFEDAHNVLGAALERKGDRRAALDEYRKVCELDPENSTARNNYERLLKELNK